MQGSPPSERTEAPAPTLLGDEGEKWTTSSSVPPEMVPLCRKSGPERTCKYEHGSIPQWLEQAPRKRRRKCSSWMNLVSLGCPVVGHLKHCCCKPQPRNSPFPDVVPALKGRRLDVEWSLDSHSTLGTRADPWGWTGNSPGGAWSWHSFSAELSAVLGIELPEQTRTHVPWLAPAH